MIVLSIPSDSSEFQGFLDGAVTLLRSLCIGWLLGEKWVKGVRACILRSQDCEERLQQVASGEEGGGMVVDLRVDTGGGNLLTGMLMEFQEADLDLKLRYGYRDRSKTREACVGVGGGWGGAVSGALVFSPHVPR